MAHAPAAPVPYQRTRWLAGSLALIAAIAAGLAGGEHFFGETFAGYWLPPAAVVLLLALFRTRQEMVAGAACMLALFLLLFHAWESGQNNREGFAWLAYAFAMPGATLGALAVHLGLRGRPLGTAIGLLAGALGTLLGLALNLGLLFSGVFG